MKHHKVVFSVTAAEDLHASFEWGKGAWGEGEARKWYSEIRERIRKILGSFPLSQPLAQDDREYAVEVRQLAIGRYRVLFNVTKSVVTILHIQGPYTGK